MKWLYKGDLNIAYFYKVTKVKRANNTTRVLCNFNNVKSTSMCDIQWEVIRGCLV